jgi:hypothetical protein
MARFLQKTGLWSERLGAVHSGPFVLIVWALRGGHWWHGFQIKLGTPRSAQAILAAEIKSAAESATRWHICSGLGRCQSAYFAAATPGILRQNHGLLRLSTPPRDEIRHFVCPEHAAVESVTTGTPRDGQRFEAHLVDVLTIRDGKIAAKRSYRKGRL